MTLDGRRYDVVTSYQHHYGVIMTSYARWVASFGSNAEMFNFWTNVSNAFIYGYIFRCITIVVEKRSFAEHTSNARGSGMLSNQSHSFLFMAIFKR